MNKKKLIIVFVLLYLFAGILAHSKGAFTIDEKHPRWFSYNGKRVYIITSGMGSIPHTKLLDDMCAAGINSYRTHIFLNYDRNNPYVLGKNANVDNNWNGFSQPFFDRLKSQAKELEKEKTFLFVVALGTPMRKVKNKTWRTHLFNSVNGGPIPEDQHGVRAFYKLAKKDFVYTMTYQSSWSWEMKSQYRQEQLFVKINNELPEKEYPNVGFVNTWEIYSGWNGEWALHMVNLLQKITKTRPIGLGTYREKDLNFINSQSKRTVFGLFEGLPIISFLEKEKVSGKCPIVVMGYHCRHKARFSGLHPENRCPYFIPGAEKANIEGAIDNIIAGFEAGINVSMPFQDWWDPQGVGKYVKKICAGKYPIEKYNSTLVKNEILSFLTKFSKAVRKINLKKVPGKKVNRKVKKWRKKHGY